MSADEVDNILTLLKFIGKIPRGGRLCVRQGELVADTSTSHLQPLLRWACGDSRDATLSHIRGVIHAAMRLHWVIFVYGTP
jgi:hypothetical protein